MEAGGDDAVGARAVAGSRRSLRARVASVRSLNRCGTPSLAVRRRAGFEVRDEAAGREAARRSPTGFGKQSLRALSRSWCALFGEVIRSEPNCEPGCLEFQMQMPAVCGSEVGLGPPSRGTFPIRERRPTWSRRPPATSNFLPDAL